MKPKFVALVFSCLLASVWGEPSECPSGSLSMAGEETAKSVVEIWSDGYVSKCPDFGAITQGGGYAMGGARVCDNHPVYQPVDIGGLLGPFFSPQASTENGWEFDCHGSDRKTILVSTAAYFDCKKIVKNTTTHLFQPMQLRVAKEGVSVKTAAHGAAAECIALLGGLSADQVRWMYSAYAESELKSSGWDPMSVPSSDGDDSTHLWSELNQNCSRTEIQVAGTTISTHAYHFFADHILSGQNEGIRQMFQSSNIEELDKFVNENIGAIYFFEMHDMLSMEFADQRESITTVPIMDKQGRFVDSDAAAFAQSDYPLLRDIYLGVDATPNSIEKTRPFIEYGLSAEGSKLLKLSGFWPIPEYEKVEMYTRLQSPLGLDIDMLGSHCGPEQEQIHIAGSSTVFPIASMWSRMYRLACNIDMELEGGGSGAGAGRVCANFEKGEPVDIGAMSREWKPKEATKREDGFVHDCLKGDQSRSSFEIEIALDGIVVALPKNGVGFACVELLGGLDLHQLRWIFSSFTEAELTNSGWDASGLVNSDSHPDTHLWSELDSRCAPEEIDLMGDPRGDGTFSEFSQLVFRGWEGGETVSDTRPGSYAEGHGFELLSNSLRKPNSVLFISYHYFSEQTDLFGAAPLKFHSDEFVSPTVTSIGDGSYPLSRSIYMNLLNIEASLHNTIPFLKFGLTSPDTVAAVGFVPLQELKLQEMMERLDGAPYKRGNQEENDDEESSTIFSSVAVTVGFAVGVCCIFSVLLGMIATRRQLK